MSEERSHSQLRPVLLVGVAFLVLLEILILSPEPLEDPLPERPEITRKENPDEPNSPPLAPGIPTTIPDYRVEDFTYVSIRQARPEWKLQAKRAAVYQKSQVVHSHGVTSHLYDSDGKATLVTGREAKYLSGQRDLEVFGEVTAKFPDGFVLRGEYMKYVASQGLIEVPTTYVVTGEGSAGPGEILRFTSSGFRFERKTSLIELPQNARVVLEKPKAPADESTTTIESDRCLISRDQNEARFEMYASRPLSERFVRTRQPKLFVRSRTAKLDYGGEPKTVNYMIAEKDVLIRDLDESSGSQRYATSGRAEFDSRRHVIVLKEFPQVYQDNDTVTGEVIVMHRDTDIVEVDYSNAFSQGQPETRDPKNTGDLSGQNASSPKPR